MGFRFIHTADWQLGKSFGGFPSDLAGELKAARRDVISTIAELATERGIGHVVVAGDVWDSAYPSNQTLLQPLEAMKRAQGIQWWLLPGNHDPHQPGGLWTRILKDRPENVRPLLSAKPVEPEPGVAFLPAPWTTKAPGQDLSAWMDSAETDKDTIRVGVAHGGVEDFGSETVVIDPNRASKARLDYLALGDWHGQRAIDERTWYSGTPEPDRFVNNLRGRVLEVSLSGPGAKPEITAHRVAKFDWPLIELDVRSRADFAAFDAALGEDPQPAETLVQLSLGGRLTLAERAELDGHLERWAGRLAFLAVRDKDLETLASADDLDALDAQGSVRKAAETLSAMAEDAPDPTHRDDAQRALSLLFTYARSDGAS